MNVYRVITRYAYSHPMLFVVNDTSEIESLYKKQYPDGSDIISVELIEGQVIQGELK